MTNDSVLVQTGICGDEQETSYMNGTLQSVGPDLEMTIHTYLDIPDDVFYQGQEFVGKYVKDMFDRLTNTMPGLSFEVRIGPTGAGEPE